MRSQTILFSVILLVAALSIQAAELGAPFEVASQAKDTRNQTWASVAWGEEAQCWLVVWREGFLNETVSDIWCARISADGTTMDPEGIRITSGEEVKDRPRVASDGKDFMVIWEDFRNGKDWDVYASRVSGKGEVLDSEPVLVAGGAHNQARPDIAFAKGNYCVMWMAFTDGMYDIRGTRVSLEGKAVGAEPIGVFVFERKGKQKRKLEQAVLPALSANRKGELLSTCFITTRYHRRYLSRQAIDPGTGGPLGPRCAPPKGYGDKNSPGMFSFFRDRCAALVMGPDNAMTVFSSPAAHKSKNDISVFLYSKTGDVLGHQELGSTLTIQGHFKPIQSRLAAAFDGERYVALSECLFNDKKKRDVMRFKARVIGWRLSADGKVEDENGFMIGGEDGVNCVLPSAAGGPKGVCLVVYSAVRGVDDVKVIARLIGKAGSSN